MLLQTDGGANFTGTVKAASFSGATATITGNVNAATLNSVKVYHALLTTVTKMAPTARVLANSLGGTVAWTYVVTGSYLGTLASAFTENKTAVHATSDVATAGTLIQASRASANTVSVTAIDVATGELTDALLTNSFIEIMVYP